MNPSPRHDLEIDLFPRVQRLLAPMADPLVLAVSGGPDSTALAHLVRRALPDRRLLFAHFDHRQRGEDSAKDLAFVAEMSQRLSADFRAGALPDEVTGPLSEASARKHRYAFLARCADAVGAVAILTGHHRDDQAETILMRLARGTGIRGLGGMRQDRPLPDPSLSEDRRLRLLRPLLDIPRERLLDFLEARDLPFRNDATNSEPRWTRNRLRLDLFPRIEASLHPEARRSIARLGRRAQRADEALDRWTQREWDRLVTRTAEKPFPILELDLDSVRDLPEEIRYRLISRAVTRSDSLLSETDFRRIEAVVGQNVRAHTLRDGTRIEVAGNALRLTSGSRLRTSGSPIQGVRSPFTDAAPTVVPLSIPGRTHVPWAHQSIETRLLREIHGGKRDKPPGAGVAPIEHLDAEAVETYGPLAVRRRRSGDRFRPLGAPGDRKLKRALIDAKIPHGLRDRLPLIVPVNREEFILCVGGFRISELVRTHSQSERILELRFLPDSDPKEPRRPS